MNWEALLMEAIVNAAIGAVATIIVAVVGYFGLVKKDHTKIFDQHKDLSSEHKDLSNEHKHLSNEHKDLTREYQELSKDVLKVNGTVSDLLDRAKADATRRETLERVNVQHSLENITQKIISLEHENKLAKQELAKTKAELTATKAKLEASMRAYQRNNEPHEEEQDDEFEI